MDKHKFEHIHHVSNKYLESFYENYSPVFILNTGRSGSAFIQNIFKEYKDVDSYHEAEPNLFLFPNFAYHNQDKDDILQNIFEAARIELILKSKVQDKIYLESNHCLVFFINQIKKNFPKAKFVHLIRHPGDFVRSAIKKGWHKNDSVWEKGRIRMMNNVEWSKMNQIEKLGWVWKETHQFIEQFKENHKNNFYTLRLEDLISSTNELIRLLNFLNIENNETEMILKQLLSNKVNEIIISTSEPSNMYKLVSFPRYEDWKKENKILLKKQVGELIEKYNYNL